MNVEYREKDATLAQIQISVQKEDLEPRVRKALHDVAKKAHIKGFRPGFAPVGMIRKLYGESVLFEEVNKILNDALTGYIQENNMKTLGQPLPVEGQKLDVQLDRISDFDFTFEVGLAPKVDLGFLSGLGPFTRYQITVEDKAVEDEIENIRKRYATYAYPEQAELNDIITFEIRELNADGSEKEGGIETSSSIMTDLLKEHWQSKLVGVKKGDVLELDVFDLMDRDRDALAKNILNLSDENAIASAGNTYRLTVSNIMRNEPAPINDEFFTKVYGEGGVNTLEDMKAEISRDFSSYYEGQAKVLLVNALYQALMDNVSLPLAEEFLKRWLISSNDKKLTVEQVEQEFPLFCKQLRWDLISGEVVKQQSLGVSVEELKERVRQDVLKQLYSYGLRNMGGEWVENFVQKQLQDNKVLDRTEGQILDDKVIDYLITQVKTQEEAISLDAFNELVKAQNEKVKQG